MRCVRSILRKQYYHTVNTFGFALALARRTIKIHHFEYKIHQFYTEFISLNTKLTTSPPRYALAQGTGSDSAAGGRS